MDKVTPSLEESAIDSASLTSDEVSKHAGGGQGRTNIVRWNCVEKYVLAEIAALRR